MKSQAKTGSILSYIQLSISILIGFLYTPIMIRCLGKSEYGLYNTVASVISMLSILSLGFNSGYIRYFAEYKKKNDEQAINKLNGLFIIVFTIIGIIALACGLFLSFNLKIIFADGLTSEEYEIAKVLMLLLTANLAISFPMSVFSNIISAHEKFIVLKVLMIIKTVISPLVTLPLLLLGYKSIALVLVTICVNVFVDILYMIYVLTKLKCKFVFKGFEKGLIKKIFIYTSFIAIHVITDQVNNNLGKFVIGRINGTEEVAIYSAGYSLYSYYVIFGLACSSIFSPRIHNIVEQNRENKPLLKSELTALFTKVGKIQFPILMLIVTGVVFFGREFIGYWAGEGYERSYYIAIILITTGTIDLIQNIGIEIQRAQEKHKFRAIVYIIMAIINIIISVIMCKLYGAIGGAIGTGVSFIIIQGITINIYYQKSCNLDIKYYWKKILRMCLGLIIPVIFGVLYMIYGCCTSLIMLICFIVVYSLVFMVSMYVVGLTKSDKKYVKEQISIKIKKKIR